MSVLTNKKLGKLIGLKKEAFDSLVKAKEISYLKPRLIPIYKLGDELALTSVFLKSLKLIKEFKYTIFSEAKIQQGGALYVYSEVCFSECPEDRLDGLILVVKSGTIRDAALLEVKNGKNHLNKQQLDRYQKIAKKHSIPKFITISNQFVSDSSQSPAHIKPLHGVEFRHFSWTYLLTIGHVLLSNRGTSVEDADQIEILKEVLKYLEYDKSGVLGHNQMNSGWVSVVEKINLGSNIKITDTDVSEAVLSWQQEERDMSLLLSRKLGVIVPTGSAKHKGKLNERLEEDARNLCSNHKLYSILRVKGAASDIKIEACFHKRTIEFGTSLKAPDDKTQKGQIGWIKRQLENCIKKNKSLLDKLFKEIVIETTIKNSSTAERFTIDQIESIQPALNGKEIKEFRILYLKDFGKRFSSPRKIIEIMEEMLIDYYVGIVQHLNKWEPSAPKIKQVKEIELEEEDTPYETKININEHPDIATNTANNADSGPEEIAFTQHKPEEPTLGTAGISEVTTSKLHDPEQK